MQRLLLLFIAVTLIFTADGSVFAQSKPKSKPVKKSTAQILAERQKEFNAQKAEQATAEKQPDKDADKPAVVNSPNRSSTSPSPAVLDNPAYAPLIQVWNSMSKESQGELVQRLMTVDPNSITELSALPGNTPDEKRMFLIRFLQSQGIEVPGAPPLSAPAPGQGEAFLTDAAGNPTSVKPAVELISQGDGAETNEPPLPLYKQSPFDEVVLTAKFENAVIKLMPLSFRITPAQDDPIRKKFIKVRLVEEPETDYNLVWSAIESFRFFEDMVAQQAIELSKQGKFEESFVYIRFLLDEYPQCKGCSEALEQLYSDEANAFFKAKKYDAALARLMEINDTYPKSLKVEKPMAKIVDILVQQYLDKDDYLSAQIINNNLLSRFPKNEIGLKWRSLFVSRCQQACDEAQAALNSQKMAQAALAVEQMKHIWPSCEDVKNGVEVIQQVETQYPAIRVGVTLPSSNSVGVSLNDWATYRSRRLMYRLMMEYKGAGPAGGTYDSSLGMVTIEDLGRRLVFKLNDNLRWASQVDGTQGDGDNLSLTGADVAGALLEMSNRESEMYSPQWASLFKHASVPSPMETVIQLNRPYVCPLALLQNPVLCYTSGNIGKEIGSGANGPYVPGVLPAQERLGVTEKLYLFNDRYFASEPTQPKMITEVYYDKGQEALKDLSSGKIVALDRINPWEVEAAKQNKNIHVYPYAVPLVHCLVPNRNKLLLSNRTYRRALVYALNREGILRNLVGGTDRVGCQVVSGPFSPGAGVNDSLGYAYDISINPRPYSPYLAFALTQASMIQIDKAQKKQAEKDAKARGITVEQLEAEKKAEAEKIAGTEKKAETPKNTEQKADSSEKKAASKKKKDLFDQKFVLAYPPHETARIACQIIARQYKAIGIEIELHEFAPGEPVCMSDEIDLLYMELAMYEPIVDAPQILSADGPSGKCSIHVEQALRELDGATDWEFVGQTMRRLHRLAYDDTAVIPLWQIRDYFGVNANIQGVVESEDTNIVSLYERIEQWSGKKESQQEK